MSLVTRNLPYILVALFAMQTTSFGQTNLWHHKEREVHYEPNGEDFLLVNGKRRFNRALYGGNTAFRVEAGDLPEFALYLPGMGGNLKFGVVNTNGSKWLIGADKIKTRYRPGSMVYRINDSLLGVSISITVLSLYEQEGIIVKVEGGKSNNDSHLIAAYGGATGIKFSRDGDIGADPESSFYLKPEYCADNVYLIDKNRFTIFYGSKRALTEEERYEIQNNPKREKDSSDNRQNLRSIIGVFPSSALLKLADANEQRTPDSYLESSQSSLPSLCADVKLNEQPVYFLILNSKVSSLNYTDLPVLFERTEARRQELANRIKVSTPDPLINTIGGALSVAADAIWENPSYLHGAVAWRMRLNGWRGAYCADVLGWHDRAEKHFNSYALSQLKTPLTGPVIMDTALHLARGLERLGTSLFSSGYISRNPNGDPRPHHYDMNLVFVDQLLNHFNWTGDTAYVRTMWPLLVRHLDWEKRNFDRDGDGLYDAYAAIWASDALQYSGGGVTHSSAYNYKANHTAAKLARIIGEDGKRYEREADKILNAMNRQLWLKDKGWFAEYKDLLGEKLVHPAAGLWTVYHAIDSQVPDAMQSYQMLRYIDDEIPHIPIRARGLEDTTLYTLSTTKWQPYTWSLNNVVLGEVLHTSLAYWQGGRSEEAFHLWKSALVESMYLGASPGNFQQISFYDAMRGELYRDFADDIGMAARSLVEGLFGVEPDLLSNAIIIIPGFPAEWAYASLTTPDIKYSYRRNSGKDNYHFEMKLPKAVTLSMKLKARNTKINSIVVNGKKVAWKFDPSSVGFPLVVFQAPPAKTFDVEIEWAGKEPEPMSYPKTFEYGQEINLVSTDAVLVGYFDPQNAIATPRLTSHRFNAKVNGKDGTKSFFIKVKQGAAAYWMPVSFRVSKPVNMSGLESRSTSQFEKIDLTSYFNDEVTNIFKNQYLSPRPKTTTLQLPTQGIGNWAYPLTMISIDDSGLRKRAAEKNEVIVDRAIPFETPSATGSKNVVFTSQWDNYPKQVSIPINGKSSHAYFLLAGSTNPMQSRMINGQIIVEYVDKTADTLQLKNPENWWPIEQDYYEDGYAFTTDAPKPLRVYLKTGEDTRTFDDYTAIKGYSNRGIDGGAATVLDMPLNPIKELKTIRLRTVANDVVVGLMSVTLAR
jgi:hypothetical protein